MRHSGYPLQAPLPCKHFATRLPFRMACPPHPKMPHTDGSSPRLQQWAGGGETTLAGVTPTDLWFDSRIHQACRAEPSCAPNRVA
eukprot:12402118-Karenia_brevis.AAC.1